MHVVPPASALDAWERATSVTVITVVVFSGKMGIDNLTGLIALP